MIGIDAVGIVDEPSCVGQRHTDGVRLCLARHYVTAELRVQRAQHVKVDIQHGGDLLQVDIPVDDDGICLFGQTGGHRAYIVVAIVCHDIVGSDKCRHVASCLCWQVGIDMPVVLIGGLACLAATRISPVDSLVDVLRPAVIGCNDQVPVTEYLIQGFQVSGCCVGRLHWVAALVYQ